MWATDQRSARAQFLLELGIAVLGELLACALLGHSLLSKAGGGSGAHVSYTYKTCS